MHWKRFFRLRCMSIQSSFRSPEIHSKRRYKTCISLFIGWSKFPTNQNSRTNGIFALIPQTSFRGEPVVASRNLSCFPRPVRLVRLFINPSETSAMRHKWCACRISWGSKTFEPNRKSRKRLRRLEEVVRFRFNIQILRISESLRLYHLYHSHWESAPKNVHDQTKKTIWTVPPHDGSSPRMKSIHSMLIWRSLSPKKENARGKTATGLVGQHLCIVTEYFTKNVSCRHKKLSGIVPTPIQYATLHGGKSRIA